MRWALAGVLVAAVVFGCNALTGVSDLAVCDGDCDDGGVLPGRSDGGGDTDARGGSQDADIPLPALCDAGTTLCTGGKVLNTCKGDAWDSKACAERCVNGACVPYPSCDNDAGAGCGPDATSCCATATVPGATFNRENNVAYPATVSTFDLDLYEVTVGRFRAFVNAGGVSQQNPPAPGVGAHPKIPGSGWQSTWNLKLPSTPTDLVSKIRNGTWTDTEGANEHKPMTNVSWLVAFAFCAWDGARLPTHAEWELAAVGGTEQRKYPWTTPLLATIDYTYASYNCGYSLPERSCSTICTGCDNVLDLADVGGLPLGKGRFGHFELAGNAEELLLDDDTGPITPCVDCATINGGGNKDTSRRLAAGGSFNDQTTSLDDGSNRAVPFDSNASSFGFRCAR